MWDRRTRFGLVAAAAVAIAVAATAITDSEDSDVEPGVPATSCDRTVEPGADVEAALESLQAGESACLAEGTHVAEGPIKLTARAARVMSVPGDRAVLRARIWIAPGADGATIESLVLDGESLDGAPSPIISANDVVFRGNEVTNDHTAICFSIGDGPGRPSGVVIESNRIHDCGELPATNHHHGIYVADAVGTVIRDNWIHDNADRGIQLYPNGDRTLVTGNVIDGNGEGIIISGDDEEASEDNLVEGNAITNSQLRYNVEADWPGPVGLGNVVRDNCIHGGARDDGEGGIESPPEGFTTMDNVIEGAVYVDREAGDYRLQPDSPCAKIVSTQR